MSALDRFGGKSVWTQVKAGYPVVLIGSGMLLLGTLSGDVIVNANTGEDLWRSKVTSEVLAAPANGDVVVVQTQMIASPWGHHQGSNVGSMKHASGSNLAWTELHL